ncbi:MAG: hypothetical protein K2M31_00325 [Muribaculaceae bacterium]|nr:hypothetical protein [Muribaculaceae bacterium]
MKEKVMKYVALIGILMLSLISGSGYANEKRLGGHEIKAAIPRRVGVGINTLSGYGNSYFNGEWQPGKVVTYGCGVNGEKILESTDTYKYTSEGWIKEYIIESAYSKTVSKVVYEYDELGRVEKANQFILSENGEFIPGLISFKEYDDILKDLVVKNSVKNLMTGEEYVTDKLEIDRDYDGNITSYSHFETTFDGSFAKCYQLIIKYENGVAIAIDEYAPSSYGETDLSLRYRFDNIEWYETDGQIIDFNYGDIRSSIYQPDSRNRVKSFKVTDDYYGERWAFANYNDRNVELTLSGEKYTIKYLDDLGSYFTTSKQNYVNANLYGGYKLIDKFGINIEVVDGIADPDGGFAEIWNDSLNRVAYDDIEGYPLTCEVSFYTSWEESEGYKKRGDVEFSDYQRFSSGIRKIENAAVEENIEYYSIDGVRLDSPGRGLTICRQGNRVRKVLH